MSQILSLVPSDVNFPVPCAVFLSGSGTNARRVLEYERRHAAAYRVALLVTDRPESAAAEIAAEFGLPSVLCDIREAYARQGLSRVSIATPEGRAARDAWTLELQAAIAPYAVALGVFAGFIPLTNLCRDLPCLNVHPGDLTVERDGERHLVGLHTIPVERAVLAGIDHLRSSVILVDPYDADPAAMDTGPILGISERVPIDLGGHTVAELQAMSDSRPPRRPRAGWGDALAELADDHQERLKVGGDWRVLPPVVDDVAAGRFGLDDVRGLYYRASADAPWQPVQTVAYQGDERVPVPR